MVRNTIAIASRSCRKAGRLAWASRVRSLPAKWVAAGFFFAGKYALNSSFRAGPDIVRPSNLSAGIFRGNAERGRSLPTSDLVGKMALIASFGAAESGKLAPRPGHVSVLVPVAKRAV